MQEIFNAKRFMFLVRKTILERPTQVFGLMGLILIVIFIVYFLLKSILFFGAAQNISFIWGLAGGGCIMASLLFSYFSSNANGSSFLTLPASQFEKWLCGSLIAFLLYPIIFLLFYRGVDLLFVTLFHHSLDPSNPLYNQRFRSVYLFDMKGHVAQQVYIIFFIFSTVAMLGSLYFNKTSIIKTALFFCAVCLGIFLLNWLFAKMFFGEIEGAFPFQGVDIMSGKETGSIELPNSDFLIIRNFINYFLPFILWLTVFIRLREKEF